MNPIDRELEIAYEAKLAKWEEELKDNPELQEWVTRRAELEQSAMETFLENQE